MPRNPSKLRLSELRRALLALNVPAASSVPGQARAAAVAAVLREAPGGAEVLLIRRAEDERDPWSGHMALPGGHHDAGDADLVATAVRETREEVGLTLDRDTEWIGFLQRARVHSGRRPDFEILPLVFAVQREVELTPNPREVKAVLWAKLDHLLLPAAQTSVAYPSLTAPEGQRLSAFDVQGHVVWGLTYRILSDLLAVWSPGTPG
jgi:8-oxo-dGTP pyrophosphatase MutT (NUDIX family)